MFFFFRLFFLLGAVWGLGIGRFLRGLEVGGGPESSLVCLELS